MPNLQRPTVSLNYADRGSGPALVFLHGWCDGSASWGATMDEFAANYRCLAPDMRGHGGSGMPSDHAYFPEALSNDVVALCEAAGVDQPVLVGHSFGGFLAAFTAARFPGFARAIVVEDQLLDLVGFAAQMQTLAPVIRSPESHMAFRGQFFESMVSPTMPPASRRIIEELKQSTPVEIGTALWGVLFEYSPAEIAANSERLMGAFANQPSLTIESAGQPEYHAKLANYAPGIRTAVIEAGHWIHLERPDEFRAELRAFLAAI